MAFTYDPSTPVGTVRLLIGDTDSAAANFSDEEILSFIDANNGDTGQAGVSALRTLARKYAAKGKRQIGDYQEDFTTQAKVIAALADTLAASLGESDDDVEIGVVGGECFWTF